MRGTGQRDPRASMGPRPCRRGCFFTSGTVNDNNSTLQWGRARAGADANTCIVRDRHNGSLQWGRARAGADALHLRPSHRIARGFNGAAPVQARMPPASRPGSATPTGFNGAAPVQARMRAVGGCSTGRRPRFNGAAPVQARMLAPEPVDGAWFGASMGPRPCRRGCFSATVSGPPTAGCFNGAAPVQARMLPCAPRDRQRGDASFNGAAPVQARMPGCTGSWRS